MATSIRTLTSVCLQQAVAGAGSISPWLLALAACMLRRQREAAAEAPESLPTRAGGGTEDEGADRQRLGTHLNTTEEFIVPSHASVEHIYWLEMARERVRQGRHIITGDSGASNGGACGSGRESGADRTGDGPFANIKAMLFDPESAVPLPHGEALVDTRSGSGMLRTWHASSGPVAAPQHTQQPAAADLEEGGNAGEGRQLTEERAGGWGQPLAGKPSGARLVLTSPLLDMGAAPSQTRGEGVVEGLDGISEEVCAAVLLAGEVEEVCRKSGYERAAWARRILTKQPGATRAHGWECAPCSFFYSSATHCAVQCAAMWRVSVAVVALVALFVTLCVRCMRALHAIGKPTRVLGPSLVDSMTIGRTLEYVFTQCISFGEHRSVCRAGLQVQCSVCSKDVSLSLPSRSGDEVVILECNHTVHLRCLGRGKVQKLFCCPDCGEESPMMLAMNTAA